MALLTGMLLDHELKGLPGPRRLYRLAGGA
jgi:hypothetical protein